MATRVVQVLFVRHAIALERVDDVDPSIDDRRPLSDLGRHRMLCAARGIRMLVPRLTTLASSPLVRAQETAAIVAAEYDGVSVITTPLLAPGAAVAPFAEWLAAQAGVTANLTLAAIGHEPQLNRIIAELVGNADFCCELKKGGARLLQFDGSPMNGGASVVWEQTPRALRSLGDSAMVPASAE